ncbi:MAG: hypothetical protein NXY57DRAFT_1042033 [Lentinula lateritia]|nr:MAG: hypothetical protein NXY57DRAFT_1042033 [Lentinula lateritia]
MGEFSHCLNQHIYSSHPTLTSLTLLDFSLSTTLCSPNVARPGNHARHQGTIPAKKPVEGQAGSGKVDGNVEKGKKKGATNGNAGKGLFEPGWDGGNSKSSELVWAVESL